MGIEELCALPVADLAAPDSALFLWATFPQLPEALRLIKAWGFAYKTNIHQFIISPVEAHSKKPDEARDKIVSLLGDLPRVELFARQTPPGWDVWGNEVESTVPDFGTKCPEVQGEKGGFSCPM